MIALGAGVMAAVVVRVVLWPSRSRGADRRPSDSGDMKACTRLASPAWLGVVTVLAIALAVSWMLAIAIGGVALGGHWWRGRVAAANHRAAIGAALPEVIDLLAVVFGAGGTAARALETLARQGPVAIRGGVDVGLNQRRAGASLTRSLDAVVVELGDAYRAPIRVLVATERDGAPVATLLERLADEGRVARQQHAEARARRLPVLLLGPLVGCFLPAVVIGTVIPLVMVSIGRLSF